MYMLSVDLQMESRILLGNELNDSLPSSWRAVAQVHVYAHVQQWLTLHIMLSFGISLCSGSSRLLLQLSDCTAAAPARCQQQQHHRHLAKVMG